MNAAVRKKSRKSKRPGKEARTSGGLQTYKAIKKLILSGELHPGSDLDEAEMIKRFSVSRTPVRESFIRLSMEGLVTILPNRGAKVSNLDFSDITDHLEVMDILTPAVCYLAALRRSQSDLDEIKAHIERVVSVSRDDVDERLDAVLSFYTALGSATQNESLSHVYKQTIYAKLRIGRVSGARSETDEQWHEHVEKLHELYLAIFRGIEACNAVSAQAAARELLDTIRIRLSGIISTSLVPKGGLPLG
jgi:DNA-binding GntR family transcriptional regulator